MEPELDAKDDLQDFTCTVCKKKFKSAEKLSLHMGFHSLFGNFKKTTQVGEKSTSEDVESNTPAEPKDVKGKAKSKAADSILLVEKPFQCTKCGANFSSMRNKMQHDLLHIKNTSGIEQRGAYTMEIKCSICNQRCRTEKGLQKHFEDNHDNQRERCEQCQRTFKSLRSLKAHQACLHIGAKNDSVAVKTPKSSKKFYLSDKYDIVIIHKKNESVKVLKCKACGHHSSSQRTFSFHVKKMHKSSDFLSDLSCQYCGKVAQNIIGLKSHITRVHKQKIFRCLLCDACFLDETDLKVHHDGMHGKGKNIKCQKCDEMFDNVDDLSTHIIKNHSRGQARKFQQTLRGFKQHKIFDKKKKSLINGYQCLFCNKILISKDFVMEHILKEHVNKVDMTSNESSKVPEKIANKATSKENLKLNDSPVKMSESKSLKRKTTDNGSSVENSVKENDIEGLDPGELDSSHGHSVEDFDANDTPVTDTKAKVSNTSLTSSSSNKKSRKYIFGVRQKPKPKTDVCRCLDCDVVLDTEWDLEEHYKHKHSGTNYQIVPKYNSREGKYILYIKCLICAKICATKRSLKAHLRNHKKDDKTVVKVALNKEETDIIETEEKTSPLEPVRSETKQRRRSCIYHCRICLKSFPRLYNYNEHKCSDKKQTDEPLEADKEQEKEIEDERRNSENNKTELDESNINDRIQVTQGQAGSCSSKEDDESRAANKKKAKPRKPIHKSIREKYSNSTQENSGESSTNHPSSKISPKKESINPNSQDINNIKAGVISKKQKMQEISTATQGKQEGNTRSCCRYCKKVFTDPLLLAKHEPTHSEFSGYMCKNCGIGFGASHKLRYHQMRCKPYSSAKEPSVNEMNTRVNDRIVKDGFLQGKSYPSFATKSEYTIFDPGNQVSHADIDPNSELNFDDDLDDNCPYENGVDFTDSDQPESDNERGHKQASRQSCLDEIKIADVRSFHPSFSANQYSMMIEQATGKRFPPEASSPHGHPYFFGQSSPAFPLQAGPQINMMHHLSPPPTVYSNGTVFFVPYFVPAAANLLEYPKRVESRNSFAQKQSSFGFNSNFHPFGFRQGSSQIYPTGPVTATASCRISEAESQRDHHRNTSSKHSDNNICPSTAETGANSLNPVIKGGETNRYECTVCQEKFETFGNFIKHRESHK